MRISKKAEIEADISFEARRVTIVHPPQSSFVLSLFAGGKDELTKRMLPVVEDVFNTRIDTYVEAFKSEGVIPAASDYKEVELKLDSILKGFAREFNVNFSTTEELRKLIPPAVGRLKEAAREMRSEAKIKATRAGRRIEARTSEVAPDTRNVFVVHGRNLEARHSLFRFLRSIGLRPLEWSQAIQGTGKAAPFIGEILEFAFSKAQAVVVLLTPDDEARLREPFRGANEPAHETALTATASKKQPGVPAGGHLFPACLGG